VEFGGPGQGFTFNFDTRILGEGDFGPGFRIGAGVGFDGELFDEPGIGMFAVIPVGVDWVFGFKNNYFDIGSRILFYSRLPYHFYNTGNIANTKYPNDKMILIIGGNYNPDPIGSRYFLKIGGGVSMSRNRILPYMNFGMGFVIK